jgi:hypothetical protein
MIEFFDELFKCSLCLGFHVGWFHIILIDQFEHIDDILNSRYMLLPFISAAVCWVADSIVRAIQSFEVYALSHKKST